MMESGLRLTNNLPKGRTALLEYVNEHHFWAAT
jgi:hypothetical protein